ncbi:hypothetical protein ABIE67_007497 [Streptomyces sp. V4I8]
MIVYRDEDRTVDDPSFRQAVVKQVESLPKSDVTGYMPYWQTKMPAQVSHDRHATYVALNLHGSSEKAKEDAYEAVKDKIPAPGLQTLQGGTVPTGHQASEKIEHDLRTAEIISAPVLFLLLLVVFGGLTAAFLPLSVFSMSLPVHRHDRPPGQVRHLQQRRHRRRHGSITKGHVNPKDRVDPDGYAQQADSIEIIDAHQRVWATSAGTFELAGLHMNIAAGRHDCF